MMVLPQNFRTGDLILIWVCPPEYFATAFPTTLLGIETVTRVIFVKSNRWPSKAEVLCYYDAIHNGELKTFEFFKRKQYYVDRPKIKL